AAAYARELEDDPTHLRAMHQLAEHRGDVVAGNLTVGDRHSEPDMSRARVVREHAGTQDHPVKVRGCEMNVGLTLDPSFSVRTPAACADHAMRPGRLTRDGTARPRPPQLQQPRPPHPARRPRPLPGCRP